MKGLTIRCFALASIGLFLITILLVWNSSASVTFNRRAMNGDGSQMIFRPDTSPSDLEVMLAEAKSRVGEEESKNTVVWINVPGFRADYVDKASASFMKEMVADGAQSQRMRPNFPPVTFAGHITMATGAPVNVHGIPGDRFRVSNSVVNQPTDAALLKAEPIWQTSTRQGIATLVHDWPLSQNQTGENKALYFLNSFRAETSDQQRLDRLWDTWAAHRGEQKLRLLMCRLDDVLKAGLENGPLAEETYAAVRRTDNAIQQFVEKTKAAWPNLRSSKADNLVFMITTDHGLAAVDKNVNIEHLIGPAAMSKLDVAAHDAIAHLYFKNLPESVAEADLVKAKIDAELRKKTYFKTYKPEDLPTSWNYTSNDGRIGDRVLILKSGFAFTDYKAEEAVFDPSEGPGLYGGYGYPVSDSFRMSGQVIVWSYPNQVAYGDLGEFDQTVFHATVCRLLKIERSKQAQNITLNLLWK